MRNTLKKLNLVLIVLAALLAAGVLPSPAQAQAVRPLEDVLED